MNIGFKYTIRFVFLLMTLFTFLVYFFFGPVYSASPTDSPDYVYNAAVSSDSPYGMAVDSNGDLYAAVVGAPYVIVYDGDDGSFVKNIGSEGTGPGQFMGPWNIGIDSQDNIYVSDEENGVLKFNSDGTYTSNIGSTGTGPGQFDLPLGIAFDSSDNVYVVDGNLDKVVVFDSDGNFTTSFGSTGSGDGQFDYPADIVIDSNDNIYVGDQNNNRIQKFDSSRVFVKEWGTNGSGNGQFSYLWGMAIDNDDYIYVTDSSDTRVQKFDSDGNYLAQWGTSGAGNGQFNFPTAIGAHEASIFVMDISNDNVQKFAYTSTVSSAPSSLQFVLTSDGTTDVTSTSQTGVQEVRLSDTSSNTVLADVDIDFSQDRDFSGITVATSTTEGKSVLKLDGNTGVYNTFTLYIPRAGKNSVLICPEATSLTEITSTCSGGVLFTGSFPETKSVGSDSVTVEQVTINAVDYWKASGLSGTGGFSLDSNLANTFEEDERCNYRKPEETTWIVLEPGNGDADEVGMYLTWTQYTADKVDIFIDDSSGTYPWRIMDTLNDGHEFLVNVSSWQNIKIRPHNNCKSGVFSPEVSYDLYPDGWFNM